MLRTQKQGLKEVYVVGCGPSLKGFNWTSLADKTTIAVNGAIQDVLIPNYFITGDSGYAIKITKSEFWEAANCNVLVMGRNHKRYRFVEPIISKYNWVISPKACDGNIGFTEDDFHTGQNSGFCGLQLAVILGAKIIHLFGFDLCITGGLHYHEYYPHLDVTRLEEFLVHFKTAIEILKQHEIKVVSHSPISLLNGVIEYKELHA